MEYNPITDIPSSMLNGIKDIEVFIPDTSTSHVVTNGEDIYSVIGNYGLSTKQSSRDTFITAETGTSDVGLRLGNGDIKKVYILSPSNITAYKLRNINTQYTLADNMEYDVVVYSSLDCITWDVECSESISNISQTAANNSSVKKSAKFQDYISIYLDNDGKSEFICNGSKIISSKYYRIDILNKVSNKEYTGINIIGITTDGDLNDLILFDYSNNNTINSYKDITMDAKLSNFNINIPNTIFKTNNIIQIPDTFNTYCTGKNLGVVSKSFNSIKINILSDHSFIKTDKFKVVGNRYDSINNRLINEEVSSERYSITEKTIVFIAYGGGVLYEDYKIPKTISCAGAYMTSWFVCKSVAETYIGSFTYNGIDYITETFTPSTEGNLKVSKVFLKSSNTVVESMGSPIDFTKDDNNNVILSITATQDIVGPIANILFGSYADVMNSELVESNNSNTIPALNLATTLSDKQPKNGMHMYDTCLVPAS